MMTLSKKIHFVLLVVFILFIGFGAFANYQYAAIQKEKSLKERIKYNSERSQLDSNEIVSGMMLNQKNAILLYLDKIKSRDKLELVEILRPETYASETFDYTCMWSELSGQDTCIIKKENAYNFYHKMTYGNGNFGYLKKVFFVEQSSILSPTEISKFLFILSLMFIIVLFVLSMTLEKNVIKPLHVIRRHLQPLRTGKFDIHIPKQTTKEMGDLTRDIINIVQELKKYQDHATKTANLVAIGESTAMVAHDVRKPLTSMKALLSALPAIKDDPVQVKKMIADVDRNITNTNAMLNDILDFSRDSTALELEEHNLQSIITSALGDALRNHPEADVKIGYEFDHGSASLYADGGRIARLLTNIIDNALGAMTPNGSDKAVGSLFFKTYLTSKEGKEWVGISVADSGPGIPEEVLPKMFEAFFTKGKKGGTGLGLAVCQKMIAMHGGKITARNIAPSPRPSPTRGEGVHGAEFVIELSAGKEQMTFNEAELIHHSNELKAFRQEEAARTDYGDTANTLEFMRINKERGRISTLLMVDDESLFRTSVKSLLSGLDQVKDHVQFVEAESAEEGLKLLNSLRASLPAAGESRSGDDGGSRPASPELQRGEQARTITGGFDYVIADIDLGKNRINGYDFAQKVLAEYPNTHVIIHSNKRKEELDIQLRNALCHCEEPTTGGRRSNPDESTGLLRSARNDKSQITNHNSHFMGFLPKPMKASELLQFLACKSFEAPQTITPSDHRTIESSNQKKVLLLNDDKNFNLAVRIMLSGDEIQVLDATNVSDAIKHLADDKNKFDAILSDINLGANEPNGYDFLKEVRSINETIPFIFSSGYSKKEEWPKAEKLGATGYLQLPFEPKEFKEMLKWNV